MLRPEFSEDCVVLMLEVSGFQLPAWSFPSACKVNSGGVARVYKDESCLGLM